MEKDRRYALVKKLIDGGYIKSFRDIFEIIPKSIVGRDLGMNNLRFSRLLNNVDRFFIKDIIRLAALLEIDEEQMLKMIYDQYKADKLVK